MSRLFQALMVIALAVVMLVNAYDFRLDFKPKAGESVAKFCDEWPAKCHQVAKNHHAKGQTYSLCERAPKPGVAQAYCTSLYKKKYTQYTSEVAKDLGATPA